tara:strand:- start:984 stop:1283 length:300 start_codon:yes stop_codon:yes gene_type:complete
VFLGLNKEGDKMSKIYEHHKDKEDIFDAMPTMNDVEQELYLIETVRVMKEAQALLGIKANPKAIQQCLTKLQEQINTAEETILQFEIDMEEMAKHYGKR